MHTCKIVPAILTKQIEYKKDNCIFFIPAGTKFILDYTKQIALFGFDHIFIRVDEYIFLH